jgi:hypothetical protein
MTFFEVANETLIIVLFLGSVFGMVCLGRDVHHFYRDRRVK